MVEPSSHPTTPCTSCDFLDLFAARAWLWSWTGGGTTSAGRNTVAFDMPEDLDRTYSYGSTKSSSLRTNNTAYMQGTVVQKERVSPSTSNNGKPPTYTLQKAARMTNKVNQKWVRIASVMCYLISISILAVVLALYYLIFYDDGYDELTRVDAQPRGNGSAAAARTFSYRGQLGLTVTPGAILPPTDAAYAKS